MLLNVGKELLKYPQRNSMLKDMMDNTTLPEKIPYLPNKTSDRLSLIFSIAYYRASGPRIFSAITGHSKFSTME
jgi:hypothetical protein